LPQATRHLTSEEDSHGNQKGSQKEIQHFEAQFVARKLRPILAQQREKEHAKHRFEEEHSQQQLKEEHPRLIRKEIQCQEVLEPQVLAICRQGCSARNARNETWQAEVRTQRKESNQSQTSHRYRPL